MGPRWAARRSAGRRSFLGGLPKGCRPGEVHLKLRAERAERSFKVSVEIGFCYMIYLIYLMHTKKQPAWIGAPGMFDNRYRFVECCLLSPESAKIGISLLRDFENT